MRQAPNYGNSKWHSLLAIEKALKSFIKKQGDNFPYIHGLEKLSRQCEELGHNKIPQELINKVQCKAGVRYGETNVTLYDAVEAHHASILLCSLTSDALLNTK